MDEHPNVELSRRGYAAFSAGDMETLTELIAEDAVWHVAGRGALAGDYNGRDAIFGFFGKLVEKSEGTLQLEVHDILANDDHSVVLTRLTAGGSSGKSVDITTCDTAHIRDGQVVEFWSFGSDQYAWDEYTS